MPRKENIRKMFDNIAPDYDKLNHILSLGIDRSWRRKAVREILDSGKPMQILDVACGTCDFSIEIARKAPAGSHVTGADISEKMLEAGQAKINGAGLEGRISLAAEDCEQLSYAGSSFDRVTVAFGVRNFEHLGQGLKEMLRVLKPGGKLVILELSVPGNPVLKFLYKLYFLNILPAIGGMISGDKGAYRYLPESVLRFPAPDMFMRMMSDCGYAGVRERAFTFGICRMYCGEKR